MSNKKYYFTKKKFIIFGIILLILLISLLFSNKLEKLINEKFLNNTKNEIYTDGLEVHFINVGQGDSIAIKLPDNKNLLIDAGPGSNSSDLINYLQNVYFKDKINKNIDYFILTHSDEDHIGGAPLVFSTFEIINVYRPQIFTSEESEALGGNVKVKDTKIYNSTIKAINNEGSNVIFNEAGNVINSTKTDISFSLEFLSPFNDNYTDVNNFSPIILLTFKDTKFMFTGDAETEVENEVLNTYSKEKLDIDILKVGHHGSNTSSSTNFLKTLTPTISVIEVGKDNKYGHPTEKTLTSLQEVGSKIYRTDINNNIVISVSLNGNLGVMLDNQEVFYVKYYYVVVSLTVVVFVFIFSIPVKKSKNKKDNNVDNNRKSNSSKLIKSNNKKIKNNINKIIKDLNSN